MANGSAPATKQDIKELRSEMVQHIEQLRSEMTHQYNDLVERMADGETRLLNAFYGLSNNKRLTEMEGNEVAIRSRIATIENRLMEVEKRLNMPPAS